MGLVNIGYLYSLAYVKCSGIGLHLLHDETEQGCLSGSVGADDTYNAVGGKHEVEVFEQFLCSERFCQTCGLDYFLSQTRTVGDEDFQTFLALLLVFVKQSVVARQTGFALCLTGFRCHAHPFKLAFKCLAAFAGLLLFLSHAFGLLVEPR